MVTLFVNALHYQAKKAEHSQKTWTGEIITSLKFERNGGDEAEEEPSDSIN